MKPYKIACYINNLTKGGSQRVLLNLAAGYAAEGHEVVLLTTYQGEDEYELPDGVARVYTEITKEETRSGRLGNFLARVRKLRRSIAEQEPEIVLSFIGKNNLMMLLSTWGMPICKVVSVRGEPSMEYYTKSLRMAARVLFRRADGVILQTEQSKAFFGKRISKKAVVLPNPLSPEFVIAAKEAPAYCPGAPIVAVGRVDDNKNHRLLIDAYHILCKPHFLPPLYIYGEGDLRQSLIAYVESLGLGDRIYLPGQVADVPRILREAGIYVLPSNTEGMPNSLMEAMVMGRVVIATDCPCGGPAMLIRHGENGLLIPVGDSAALAEALSKVLCQEEYAASLGRQAALMREELDPERVFAAWKGYLDGIVSKAQR